VGLVEKVIGSAASFTLTVATASTRSSTFSGPSRCPSSGRGWSPSC